MGCGQSAAADVQNNSHATIVKDNNIRVVKEDPPTASLSSPTIDSYESLPFPLTENGYVDIREELSQLIELHNSVANIRLYDVPDIVSDPIAEDFSPEELVARHEKVLVKLKDVYCTRAIVAHNADLETITAHEDVRLQLCEFFSKC
jgi:hypothetical protein